MRNFFLLSITLLLAYSRAWACSCVDDKLPENHKIAKSYAQSSVVFTGRVTKVEPFITTTVVRARSPHSGQDTTYTQRHESLRYTFAVSQLLKGEAVGPTVLVETESQSAACGVSFAVGSEQLVYGYTVAKQADTSQKVQNIPLRYATSLCSRHQELRNVKLSELRQLRQMARKASGEHKFTWFELGD
jgi:hypothetical protein